MYVPLFVVFEYGVDVGDKEKAAEHLRLALQVHPWAAHLPTILISIIMEKENMEEERNATPSLRSENSASKAGGGDHSDGSGGSSGGDAVSSDVADDPDSKS